MASQPPSILAILLDFDRWAMGRAWSYTSSYGIIDGFDANGCTTIVLPSLNTGMTAAGMMPSNPWVDARDKIIGDRTFDQAWVWITHSYYSEDFWKWLSSIAPVRVGVLMESLTYSAAEIAAESAPRLALRQQAVLRELEHVTHVLSLDECDVDDIALRTGLPTRLNHAMLPAQMFCDLDAPNGANPVFLGSIYEKRKHFLAASRLEPPLVILAPPENATDLPQRFDATHAGFRGELDRTGGSSELCASYVEQLRGIRKGALDLTCAAYRSGFASVNLPSLFKGFPGRVLETMAAATPLVTPHLHDRPETESAFVHERDVLYFDSSDPTDFARQVGRLARDPALRQHLVTNARANLRHCMSSAQQVRRLLDWIESTTHQATKLSSPISAAQAPNAPPAAVLSALFGEQPYFPCTGTPLENDGRSDIFLIAALGAAVPHGRPTTVLEAGSSLGASTLSLAQAIARYGNFGGSIVCIDDWTPGAIAPEDSALRALHALDFFYPLFVHNIRRAPAAVQIDTRRGQPASILPLLESDAFDLVHLRGCDPFDAMCVEFANAARIVRDGGIICGGALEAQVGDFDLDFAIAHRDRRTVIEPVKGVPFHPGVALAAYALFGRRIQTTAGFWAVRKAEDSFEDLALTGLRSFIPEHLPEVLKGRCRTLFEPVLGALC